MTTQFLPKRQKSFTALCGSDVASFLFLKKVYSKSDSTDSTDSNDSTSPTEP